VRIVFVSPLDPHHSLECNRLSLSLSLSQQRELRGYLFTLPDFEINGIFFNGFRVGHIYCKVFTFSYDKNHYYRHNYSTH
jgi:hypothetical protein